MTRKKEKHNLHHRPSFDALNCRIIGKGFIESVPIIISVFAFGLIFGVLATKSGLTIFEIAIMCVIVLAGMSQFAALPLFAAHVNPLAIIGTTFIINMRHLIMGASISRFFSSRKVIPRMVAAYFLIDESFAMASAYAEKEGERLPRDGDYVRDYLIGAGLAVTVSWSLSSCIGGIFGNFLGDPKRLGLDFAIAAAFLGLLAPQIKKKQDVLVMLVSVILSVSLFVMLPGSWYILGASLVASLIGAVGESYEN